jgi:hypothetical protein
MSPAMKHFIRHYAEMVVAMFLGMAILGLPAGWALNALGTSMHELHTDAPALMLLAMATMMAVPMVGWMRYRGHGRRPNTEMAASMFIPTLAVMALLPTGIGAMTLMGVQHALMLPAMLVAMLLRPAEYSSHHGHAHRSPIDPVAEQVRA